MSAVIDDCKRIESKIPLKLYEIIRSTGKSINDAVNDALNKEFLEEKIESDCEQIKFEMKNRVLAAETRTEAKERQVKELSVMIEEANRSNSMLNEKLRKLVTKRKEKLKTLYIWLFVSGFISGVVFLSIILYIIQNN